MITIPPSPPPSMSTLRRARRGGQRRLVCLCVLLSVGACSKSPPASSGGEHVAPTDPPLVNTSSPPPKNLPLKRTSSKVDPIRFDDCTVFRANDRYTQWQCRPRGLFIFRPDASPQLEGSRPFADLASGTLATVYRSEEWEMIKRPLPATRQLASSTTTTSYVHLEMKSRSLNSLVTAIGAALPDNALAFCVLPATLPNAAGLCKKTVDSLLTGQRPPNHRRPDR